MSAISEDTLPPKRRLRPIERRLVDVPQADRGARCQQPRAIARPRPCAPPVTTAVWPLRSIWFMSSPAFLVCRGSVVITTLPQLPARVQPSS